MTTLWDRVRNSLVTALRRQRAMERALICIAVAGVGVAAIVLADPEDGLLLPAVGAFLVFVGIFLWVRLGQLSRKLRELTRE